MNGKIKRFLALALVFVMAFSVMPLNAFAAEETNVAKIGNSEYATLAAAITAAQTGDTITFLADVTEDVTIGKKLTIDGADYTYTGKMTLKADTTINNVNFDGKGYNGYAVETRGANYLTIEDCTAKNYGYGFVQLASGTALTTVKDVVVSNMNYGVKVDYSGAVVLDNVDITANVAGVLNSNYGEKTITIKNSDINILGTWTRNNVTKTNIVFQGENTVDQFKTDANIDVFKLAADATLTAPEGLDVTTDVADRKVVYEDGVYSLVVNGIVAVGDNEYTTLAAAIKAAKAGDTITFLADVTEDVTINKNLTIDGAGYAYTGTMTAKAGLTVTVKNVNFVNGGFDKPKANKSTTGSYTIKDCTFDGEGEYAYPLRFYGANKVTVENCTVKDYLYSFLYVPSAAINVSVKNVTVENCPNYAVYFASGVTNATFENLTVKNSNNGFVINNTANRAFTIKNCNMENVGTAINHSSGTNTITCTALGVNDFGGAALSKYVKLGAAAQIGTKFYSDLKTAIADAKDGDVITIVADQTIKNSEACIESVYNKYYVFAEVTDKNVTIDLNGKVITITPDLDKMLIAVLYSAKDGEITLKDSSESQTGAINVTASEASSVYSMFTADEGGKFNIESGNYYLNRVDLNEGAPRSLIYASDDMHFTVTGGNFVLGNAHTSTDINGGLQPWIFNGYKNKVNRICVTGGTYNVDPTHYHGEAHFPKCYKVLANEDGTYSVVYAPVAVIGDEGYETLKDAVAAAKDGDVITVVADHELDNATAEIADYDMYAYMTVSDKKITIDLNGKTITANPSFDKRFYGVIVVNGTGDVTLTDSSADKTGAINVTAVEGTEIYSMLSTDGNKSKLTIEDGNYYIDKVDKGYSMIYIAQTGTGYVSGGNFVLGNAKTIEREGGVMAPWIFNTAGNGVNFVEVTGGRYNTDPTHHWGEAKFKRGYVTVQAEDGMWKLVRGPVIVEQPTDITIGYNKMAHFAPEIKGDGLTYKWYYKDANTSWHTSTLTTSTYDIKGIASRDGRQVYCVATDCTGKSVRTEIATLHVVPNEELTIVKQPKVVEGELNKNVSVALDVEGDGLTYVWYYSDNGGKSYYKSSLTTATYDIILKEERMGRKVYCIITDAFGDTVKSDVITINAVQSIKLKVLSAPVYQAVAVGKTAKITLDVQGEGLKYTWYYSLPGKTTFYKSSIADSEYKITLSADRVGRNVYCVITDAFGNSVQTETITLYAQ